jgi:hypothetical protein
MSEETPISSDRARGAGIWAIIHMIAYFGAAGFAWGLALRGSLLWYAIFGGLVGLVVGTLFGFLVVSRQRTEERVREMMFVVGATWGNLAILGGALGLVIWVVRLVFFR